MKLNQLLEEVKVGKEEYENTQTTESLLENFDEDIDNYRISNILKSMINKLSENLNESNKSTISTLRKAQNKIAMYEDKLEERDVSKAYARMKLESLTEDYNSIVEAVTSKKVQRSLNSEALAHSIALLQFQQKNLSKKAEVEPKLKNLPETYSPIVSKEYNLITEAIG